MNMKLPTYRQTKLDHKNGSFKTFNLLSFYKELPALAGNESTGYKGSAPLTAILTPLKLICTVGKIRDGPIIKLVRYSAAML